MKRLVSKLSNEILERSGLKKVQQDADSSQEELRLQDIQSYYRVASSLMLKVDEIENEDRKLILVADDEQLTCDLVEEFLNEAEIKCDVITAVDGDKAFDLATSFVPDLIITDWLMPEMDGPELIVKLKDNPSTSKIPIILITGLLPSSDELAEVLEAGATDYLRKPIDYTELKTRVRAALTLNECLKEVRNLSDSLSLKNSHIKFMLEAMPNPTFCLDGRGFFEGCNKSFEKLARKTAIEMEGQLAAGTLPMQLAALLPFVLEKCTNEETIPLEFSMTEIIDRDQHTDYVVTFRTFGDYSERLLIGQVTEKIPRYQI